MYHGKGRRASAATSERPPHLRSAPAKSADVSQETTSIPGDNLPIPPPSVLSARHNAHLSTQPAPPAAADRSTTDRDAEEMAQVCNAANFGARKFVSCSSPQTAWPRAIQTSNCAIPPRTLLCLTRRPPPAAQLTADEKIAQLEKEISNLHETLTRKAVNSRNTTDVFGRTFVLPVDEEHKASSARAPCRTCAVRRRRRNPRPTPRALLARAAARERAPRARRSRPMRADDQRVPSCQPSGARRSPSSRRSSRCSRRRRSCRTSSARRRTAASASRAPTSPSPARAPSRSDHRHPCRRRPALRPHRRAPTCMLLLLAGCPGIIALIFATTPEALIVARLFIGSASRPSSPARCGARRCSPSRSSAR